MAFNSFHVLYHPPFLISSHRIQCVRNKPLGGRGEEEVRWVLGRKENTHTHSWIKIRLLSFFLVPNSESPLQSLARSSLVCSVRSSSAFSFPLHGRSHNPCTVPDATARHRYCRVSNRWFSSCSLSVCVPLFKFTIDSIDPKLQTQTPFFLFSFQPPTHLPHSQPVTHTQPNSIRSNLPGTEASVNLEW